MITFSVIPHSQRSGFFSQRFDVNRHLLAFLSDDGDVDFKPQLCIFISDVR